MKKTFLIVSLLAIVAITLSSCGSRGHCYCEAYSPYVDRNQMYSTADAITTPEGCEQYDSGSAGFFHCFWVKD